MDYMDRMLDFINDLQFACEGIEIRISKDPRQRGNVCIEIGTIKDKNFIVLKRIFNRSAKDGLMALHKSIFRRCQKYIEKDCKDVIEA